MDKLAKKKRGKPCTPKGSAVMGKVVKIMWSNTHQQSERQEWEEADLYK